MARDYGRQGELDDALEMFRGFAGGKKGLIKIAIVVAVVILLMNSFETVGAGERGVVFSKFGGVQELVRGEGLQFKIPFIEDIIQIDVKIQKAETDATASSKDWQIPSFMLCECFG